MIYPTRAAALAAAAGVPLALAVAVVLPGWWYAALAWPIAVGLLCLVDAFMVRQSGRATIAVPATAEIGAPCELDIAIRIDGPVRLAEVAIAADPLLVVENDGRRWLPLDHGRGRVLLPVTPRRRGTARIATLWLRWRGPLGLVWRQRAEATGAELCILPDLKPVRERGAELLRRYAIDGLVAQADRGEGSEFDALVEFRPGMDRRAIDWKQSARHTKLHAQRYRPERNNQVVLAIDTGRQMSDPVGGMPRVDRAVTAALLAAWIALKLGDRVALVAFADRPRLSTGFVGGARAFGTLQRRAAAIDYSAAESNYTYALTDLAGRLTRRSTVVLFTEFTDTVAASFLIRAVEQLVTRHLLLVVVLRDEELEGIVGHAPDEPADITRSVTAAGLLRDRLLVLTRLRHLGVHVVEATADRINERLVAAYVDLKRRSLA